MTNRTHPVFIQPFSMSHKFIRGKRSAHAMVPGCNFKCVFCGVRPQEAFKHIPPVSEAQIKKDLEKATAVDGSIKIGGQEASLRPRTLNFLARTAHQLGCEVIIDTNGSNPEPVLALAREGTIDQVEVGVKGFSREEAQVISGTGNPTICWENPMRLIDELTANYPKVRVLASFVVWQPMGETDFSKALALFSSRKRPNMYVRFTNYEDPLFDRIRKPYEDFLKKEERFRHLSDSEIERHVRDYLNRKHSMRGDLVPIPERDLIERVSAVSRGTYWEGRLMLVLNRIGHIGANGTEGLAWL